LTTNLFETAYVHPIIASSRLHWFLKDIIMKLAMSFLVRNRDDLSQEVGGLPLRSWRKVFVNRHDEIMPYLVSIHVCETTCANLHRIVHIKNLISHLIYLTAAIPQATPALVSIPALSPPKSSQLVT
jgi:hypothetical protein